MTEQTTQPTPTRRIFQIGANRIVEDETTRGLSPKEVQTLLAPSFPEIAHAEIRTRQQGDDEIVEYATVVGRKG